jgi:hypothetical protein
MRKRIAEGTKKEVQTEEKCAVAAAPEGAIHRVLKQPQDKNDAK